MKATKLRNPIITKVDLVDDGANQGAAIMLFKRKAGEEVKKGMGIFDIIKSAITKSLNPEGKRLTFKTAIHENTIERELDRHWWDFTSALRRSITTTMADDKTTDDEKKETITQSLAEFSTAMIGVIFDQQFREEITKAGKAISNARLDRMKDLWVGLGEIIAEAEGIPVEEEEEEQLEKENKEDDVMKIDTSKMSAEERAQYEIFKSKYGVKDDGDVGGADGGATGGTDGVLTATIESLQKRLSQMEEQAEMGEMLAVAKKYEAIGEKPEDLAKTLHVLKKSGSTDAYDKLIATLDSAANLVAKSGLFGEIGKSGSFGKDGGSDAWSKIEAVATEIAKSKGVSRAEALDQACMENPTLVAEYEAGR